LGLSQQHKLGEDIDACTKSTARPRAGSLGGALLGWAALLAMMTTITCMGPMFKLVRVDPWVRCAWRMQVTAVCLCAPGAAWWYCLQSSAVWTKWSLIGTGLCAIVFLGMFVCWNISLDKTSFVHAQVFPQLHPVYLLLYECCTAKASPRLSLLKSVEAVGVALALSGVVLAIVVDRPQDAVTQPSFLGDSLAVLNGILFACYLMLQRLLCKGISTIPFQVVVTALMAAMSITFFPAFQGSPYHDSANAGILDWPRSEFLLYVLGLGVAGMIINLGMTFALKRLSALPVSVGVLTTPVFQMPVGYALGVTSAPGIWACVGGGLALVGVACIVVTSHAQVANTRAEETHVNRAEQADAVGYDKLDEVDTA